MVEISGQEYQELLNRLGNLEAAVADYKRSETAPELQKSQETILRLLREVKEGINKINETGRMDEEFVSLVSHELRTPLTPLLDYAFILYEGLAGPITHKQKEIFSRMINLGKRELNLINSMFDLSQMERGTYVLRKVPLKIEALIMDLLADMEKEARDKKISLKTGFAETLPVVKADEDLLVRLIAHLFNNALKYTPEGGKVEVKLGVGAGEIKCEIVDTGIGIAKENIEKIFNKFYQADSSYSRRYKGLGLGLAICRQIIEAHGGKIWAESEGLGKGTKITFTLPLTA